MGTTILPCFSLEAESMNGTKTMTRTVIFANGPIAATIFEAIEAYSPQVQALVIPEQRSALDQAWMEQFGEEQQVPVIQHPKSNHANFIKTIRSLQPDLFIVFGYARKIPAALLSIPRLGCVNVHTGLLPEYRGGHVLQWAIIRGEKETGITLHYMVEEIDAGPIIARESIPIRDLDDAQSLSKRLIQLGGELLHSYWPVITSGHTHAIEQDESRACYYPLRTADDGRIHWHQTSRSIFNLVRALVKPWPGAFTFINDQKVVVYCCQIIDPPPSTSKPGSILWIDDSGVAVACGDGAVLIAGIEIDGLAVEPADYSRFGIKPGNQFT